MSHSAICINCGKPKQWFRGKCPSCGFKPEVQSDLAKSLMLSTQFEVQSNEFGNEDISKSWKDLLELGDRIEKGEGIDFAPRILALAEKEVVRADQLLPKSVLRVTLLWISPLILGGLLLIAYQLFLKP